MSHYMKFRREGCLPPLRPAPPKQVVSCAEPGCDRPTHARRLCKSHYQRWLKRRTVDEAGVACSVDGCPKAALSHGLCNAHYQRMLRYGDPTAPKPPSKPCAICHHPSRQSIERELLRDASHRSIMTTFGLSEKQVGRHARLHMGLSKRPGSARCAICTHPDLLLIEELLGKGVPPVVIDRRYGWSRQVASHHRAGHMTEQWKKKEALHELNRLSVVSASHGTRHVP